MKRIISFLLLLTLIAGLLPAVVLASGGAADTATEPYTYVFSSAAHTGTAGASGLCNYETNSYTTNAGLHTLNTTVESVSAAWGFVAQSAKTAGYTVAGMGTEKSGVEYSRISIKNSSETNMISFDPDGEGTAVAVCFEIEVEKGGEFIPTFTHVPLAAYGPILELYLAPKGETAPTNETLSDYVKSLDSKCRIGVVDTSKGGTETFNSRPLSAGNYYFILVLNGDGVNIDKSKKLYYCQPKSLTLVPRGLQLTAMLGADTLEIGESTKITASASMSDGGALPGEVTYSFASKNTGVAGVDADGSVTAVSDGTAEIVVTASCGTLKSTKTLLLKVTKPLPDAPVLTYDFNQIDGKTSNDLLLDTSNAGYDNTTGTWEYVKVTGTTIKTVSVYGVYASMYDTTDYVAFKLNIPYAGKYNAKLLYHQNAKTGGVGDVFLIPASADISTTDAVDENKEKINLLRDISYFNTEPEPVNKYDVEGNSGIVTVPTAGEYYLIFRSTGTHNNTYGQYPHKLILEGKDTDASAVMYATVSTSKKEIKPGETAEVVATGWMNNGEVLSGDVSYTYEPSDSSVISIDEKGKITGLKDGRVSIKVTLSVGERALTYEVPFIVDSTEKTGYTVFYNIAEVSEANITSKPAFATMTPDSNDNFWGYLANSDNTESPNWAFSYTESGLCIGQNRWASFVINVPVEGVYTMYIEHGMHKEGCDVGVYVSDGDKTDSPIDDAYFVGSFNTLDKNADNYKTLNANPSYIANVSLKKGLNRVAFRAPKSSGNAFAVAGNIILDGGEKTLLMYADMEISDGGKVTLSGKMSDGTDADLSRAEVKYTSSNTEVVEVPTKGNALIIKATGETTITAQISLNGEAPVTATKTLNITKLPEAFPGIDVEYNFYERNMSWDPVNNPPEGFDAATYPGDLRGITYQYTGVTGPGNWQYGMVGGNAAWTPKYGQVFMYEGAEDNPEKFLRLQLPKVGDWVAFDIKVPQKGRYVAEFLYSVQGTYATKSDIFILPKDGTTDTSEEITEILKTATPLGTADYYDENVVKYKAETIELGELQFEEEGEYRLVFKRRADSVFGYDFPKKLTLYGKNEMHYIDIYMDKQKLEWSDTAKINVIATRLDGSVLSPEDYTMVASSSDSSIVSVSNDGVVTGKGDGTATISVKIEDKAGNVVTGEFVITAVDNTEITGNSLVTKASLYVGETTDISWQLTRKSGNIVTIPAGSITYDYSEPGIVSIDNMGVIRGEKAGTVEISASATFCGEEMTAKATVEVGVDDRKTEPTYYTYEKREAIAENVRKYDWAKSQMKSACNQADKYLDKYMTIYAQLPGEGIPRSVRASLKDDPDAYTCRYCGTDLTAKYAGGLSSGFAVDIVSRPWQVQCMECKRLFPSNDFESFFELGRDRQGYFDVDRARQKHHEMLFHDGAECECEAPAEEFSDAWYEFYGYGNPKGFLYNELYSELRDESKPESYNKDPRTGEAIDGNRWGVDDGFGYKPGRMATETCEEIHTYIAVYNRELHAEMEDAILYLTRAYLFSGDKKYGRAGAILTDRLADLYPSYDLEGIGGIKYAHNDGNRGVGKIFGCISEANYTQRNALACDAFFPMLEDKEVIEFLSSEAEKRGLENDKSTPEKIWDNWERGILDEIYYAMQRRQINGNFGMKQNALACAAIIRDREPLTSEMLKWLYATDTTPNDWHKATGGDLMTQLIDVVDRDGNNNES
ncbi:MAG: Ig-like domain-containing protein, partial [Oscillospiraceae bacterium]|nr:Ig-like domain-containing protein [Oscillospiraceae bacterium]